MAYFHDAAEVDQYIGGVFRAAAAHDEIGPKFKATDMVLRVYYSDPDVVMNVVMKEPEMTVTVGDESEPATVTLLMKSDTGDKFWRGEYNLAVGLAKGEVKAKGPVNKILKLVPLAKSLFPIYRALVADKDAANA
ncbi:SCP2 sterol-binding domain-containing protein [Nocardioides dubius]|uniref:SCP2 sterol-binding domain-containing protein n=1 Tax=Nocardioides dubius TaxID=317019 RepID=A0ABP4EKS8_9ACTN